MDFSVLENVPKDMRPKAKERLTLKRDLGVIFPRAYRIFVCLPGDAVVSENGNGQSRQFIAIIRSSGEHQKFKAPTAANLLIQAQQAQQREEAQDGK